MSHPSQPIKTYVGVDGCKGGWIAVRLDAGGKFLNAQVYADFKELWAKENASGQFEVQLLLIDIPIGLPSRDCLYRHCDVEGRVKLRAEPNRQRSIFSPPCRAALTTSSHEKANQENIRQIGVGLSRQSWGIIPKISEIDDFLKSNKSARKRICETHPELAFWSLNNKVPMQEKKKTKAGRDERLKVLQIYIPNGAEIVDYYKEKANLHRIPSKIAGRDDIIDALVAALVASFHSKGQITSIPNSEQRDSAGLRMEMIVKSDNCTT